MSSLPVFLPLFRAGIDTIGHSEHALGKDGMTSLPIQTLTGNHLRAFLSLPVISSCRPARNDFNSLFNSLFNSQLPPKVRRFKAHNCFNNCSNSNCEQLWNIYFAHFSRLRSLAGDSAVPSGRALPAPQQRVGLSDCDCYGRLTCKA